MKKLLILILLFSPAARGKDTVRSIYRISPYTDGAIIAAGFLTSGAFYAFQNSIINKRCPCDPGEVGAFDRSAIGNDSAAARTLSDLLVGCAMTVPVIVDYLNLGWSDAFIEDAIVFAEVLAVNSGLVTIVKHAVQRPLPLAYSGQYANISEGYRSFYSGHTSTFFAAGSAVAMTLSYRYDTGVWPWLAVGALGTTVGIARVKGGNHFPSDVIVGGIVGTAIGIAVPWLHRRNTESEKIILAPLPGGVQAVFYRWW